MGMAGRAAGDAAVLEGQGEPGARIRPPGSIRTERLPSLVVYKGDGAPMLERAIGFGVKVDRVQELAQDS